MPDIPTEVILNTNLTFNFNATDDISGIAILKATLDGNPIQNNATIIMSQVGEHIFRLEAIDKAGNPSIQERKFKVIYKFEGFLPPLQKEAVFNQGRSIPVKFQLFDVNNQIVSTAQASLFFAFVQNGTLGEFQSAVSSGESNSGNKFRFDEKDQQYIFNWNMSSLTPGNYRLRTDLDDGKAYSIEVELKDNKQTASLSVLLNQISNIL